MSDEGRVTGDETMAYEPSSEITGVVRKYIEEPEKNRIHVSQALIFGSHAKGTANNDSDIDVALISEAFTGNRFEDRRKIVPLRRHIDTRIEPIPLKPEDFNNGGTLVEEIKRTGIVVLKREPVTGGGSVHSPNGGKGTECGKWDKRGVCHWQGTR
jgi:predicted nucleotidyltransferase